MTWNDIKRNGIELLQFYMYMTRLIWVIPLHNTKKMLECACQWLKCKWQREMVRAIQVKSY